MPSPEQTLTNNINRWLVISVAVYIILVLNLMEPFGITLQGFMLVYHLMLSSYALVSSLTVALVLSIMQAKSEINLYRSHPMILALWVLVLVFVVSLSNWLYSQLLHHTISGWRNMYIPVRSFSQLMPQFLALYSLWGVISWALIYMLQKSKALTSSGGQEGMVLLPSENQSDGFKVRPKQIVCFKTSDNYLDVYYLNENKELQNRMIRSSMKKMEDSLNIEDFYRSHQSYLINVAYIKGLKKVKNSHFLEMSYLDFDVSISRKNLKNIKSYIIN